MWALDSFGSGLAVTSLGHVIVATHSNLVRARVTKDAGAVVSPAAADNPDPWADLESRSSNLGPQLLKGTLKEPPIKGSTFWILPGVWEGCLCDGRRQSLPAAEV